MTSGHPMPAPAHLAKVIYLREGEGRESVKLPRTPSHSQ
jgi:hypothetical protein